jgi:hypothetical protein
VGVTPGLPAWLLGDTDEHSTRKIRSERDQVQTKRR